jgi:hypothetical protein
MPPKPLRRLLGSFAASPALALVLAAGGCSGGGADQAPAPADEIARPAPPIATDRGEIYNVTIHTGASQFLVDKLEIEFNRRRGIHEFYGFYRDSYDTMARVPFTDIERVEFLGEMPVPVFEQAIVGREQENLHQENAFRVRITFRDSRQEEFFAIIPKFRGEKDLQLWEFPMSNRNPVIAYIDYDR